LLGRATDEQALPAADLAPLMSIPTGERYPPLDLTPQQLKARVFEVLVGQVAGLAAHQPVLIVVEDVHWMDPCSRSGSKTVLQAPRGYLGESDIAH
jgi:predicted ATPase